MKEGLLKCSGAEAGERFARNQFFIGLTSPNWVVSMWPCGLPFNSPKKGFSNKKHTHTHWFLFVCCCASFPWPSWFDTHVPTCARCIPTKTGQPEGPLSPSKDLQSCPQLWEVPNMQVAASPSMPLGSFPSLIVKTAFSKCADWVLAISSPGSICVSTPLTSRSSPSTGGPLE